MITTALTLALLVTTALDPFPPGTPTAGVHFLDVGQGVSTLVVSPTGRTLLIDGGVDGVGNSVLVPVLKGLGITRLDHMVATHWHPDHVGGLDEVIQAGYRPGRAWDRGDTRRPSYSAVSGYLSAVGSGQRTMTPGTTLDLGGGMVALCVAANGQVVQGPTVSFSGANQEENGRSIALRIRYQGFDLWVGGDLTGGGSGTADVEGPAGRACGDVDVYLANHHGSNTSSSAGFLASLRPEVGIFSAGANNPYGHPTATVMGRLSPAGRVIPLLCTTRGAGAVGAIVAGTVALRTDGYLYTLDAKGQRWTLAVDGQPGVSPGAGTLRLSEFQRRPAGTTGAGEWVEWCHTGAVTLDLLGLRLAGSASTAGWVLGARLLHPPGVWLTAADDGDPGRNGGLLPHLVWPPGSLVLADSSGWISLAPGEKVTYTAAFPGGLGRTAERRDLHGGTGATNWTTATAPYGSVNYGTPGRPSLGDTTRYPPALAVDAPLLPGRRVRFTLYSPATVGSLHLVGLSGGTTPGIRLQGHLIPLNPDALFATGLLLPGLVGWIPADGVVGPTLTVPPDPHLMGLPVYAAGVVLDPWSGLLIQGVTGAHRFRLP